MKIVVMSDTHLYKVTEEFEDICSRYCDDADMVIHLGDWVKTSILDFMEQYPLEAVFGNTDDHILQSRLPAKKVVRAGSHRIGIIHGWGSAHGLRGRLQNEFSNVDAILFGHTHQALQAEDNGVFWFNPGSMFMGRQGAPCSLGILHIQDRVHGEIIPL